MASWCQDRRLWVSCRVFSPVAYPSIQLLTGYSFKLSHAQLSCPFEPSSHECTFGVCMWNMCLGCPVCSLSPFGLCNSRSIIPRTSGLGISPEFPLRGKAAQCQKQVSRQREQSKKQGNDIWGMVVFNISWERMLYALWRVIIDTISLIITQLWMKMLGFFSFFKIEVLQVPY